MVLTPCMRATWSTDEILEILTDAAIASSAEESSVGGALVSALEVMVPRLADVCIVELPKPGGALEVVAAVPEDEATAEGLVHGAEELARARLESLRGAAARVVPVSGASVLVTPTRVRDTVGLVTLCSSRTSYEAWSPHLARALSAILGRIAESAGLRRDLEKQRDRLRLLADLSHALGGALGIDAVARVVAQGLGGAAAVVFLEADGSSTVRAVADVDPRVDSRLRVLEGRPLQIERTEPGTILHRIVSGEPYFRAGPEALADMQPFWATFIRTLERDFGKPFVGCIVAPLRLEGRVVGFLAVARHGSAPRFEEDDVQLVGQIAERCSVAIDRARLWEQQARLIAREQSAVASRDEFLAIACHELNTPLTALTLQLQSMQRRGGALEPAKVDAAARQVGRLNKLVGELLDVARLREDRVHLERETFDLAVLVRDVARRLEAELTRSGSTLTLEVNGPVLGVWDRMRIEQAIGSIVSNAIKYGLGNPIDVSLSSEHGLARLVVRDRGIGIAEPDQERIFERFGRAAPRDHYSGLGLGLWSARRIVEASGGRILVESSDESGATFTMELPATPVDETAPVREGVQ